MKTTHLIMLAATLALALPAQSKDGSDLQIWTNIVGRSVEAEFVSLVGDSVTLNRDGRLFSVSLATLSPDSARMALDMAERLQAASPGGEVLSFCSKNLGRKVGNGQCATLAVEALKHAKAAGMGKDSPGAGDYVWGKQVALLEAGRKGVKGMDSLANVQAGDIIQFRNARLEGTNRIGRGTYWMSADHHTAIVASADMFKGELTVLHQNWGKKTVRQDILCLADLKRGWLRIYRPQPASR